MPAETPKKKVVGIVIDAYKLSLFEKRLKEHNYLYVNAGPSTIKDTILLKVETDNMQALAQLTVLTNKQALALGRSNLT